MIIGIDVREGIEPHRAGKGEYVYQLVSRLILHNEHQFILLADAPLPTEWRRVNVTAKICSAPAWLWQLWAVGYLEFRRPVEVYFSPTSLIVPALVRHIPVVTAIMDFVSFLFPIRHNAKTVILEKLWMRPALQHSREIIAISECTKQDAIKLFNIKPENITVTYLAAGLLTGRGRPYALPPGKLILAVGTLEPRKNIERLIAAFNRLKPNIPESKLILMGRWGWQNKSIRRAIEESPFKSDIVVISDVEADQKAAVYREAAVLAFPSLYEGFGLPLLEAMTLGVPVVAARTSSIPEVVGDAALLVDPLSVDELTAALSQILQNPAVAEELKHKGQQRAQLFTWDKTATRTLQVLLKAKSNQ